MGVGNEGVMKPGTNGDISIPSAPPLTLEVTGPCPAPPPPPPA